MKKQYLFLLFCFLCCFSTAKAQQNPDLYAQEILQEVMNGLQFKEDYIAMKSTFHLFHASLHNQKGNGFNDKAEVFFKTIRQNITSYPQKIENLTPLKQQKKSFEYVNSRNQKMTANGAFYTYQIKQNNGKKTTFDIFFDDNTPTQGKILNVGF